MSLKNSKTIVIKIGSSLLVDKNKKIRKKWLSSFAKDVQELITRKKKIVIVSSGAIALGCIKMDYNKKKLKLDKSQAIASIGQIELMNLFSNTFSKYRLNISQILLTLEDTEERRRSLNAKRTFQNLFDLNFIPIVNENDTIATSEIKYGDNDRLASRVAQITNADTLVLLSDVDGLYTKNPKKNNSAKLIHYIKKITKSIEKSSENTSSTISVGGMTTKLKAAKISLAAGCSMFITKGDKIKPISSIFKEKKFTLFSTTKSPKSARKKWISSQIIAKGSIKIDLGAEEALKKGASLLPAGIISIAGTFEKGDIINVLNKKNKIICVGLSSYPSKDAKLIAGAKSDEIEGLLGYHLRDVVIHRDDMVLRK